MPAFIRTAFGGIASHVVLCSLTAVIGLMAGWFVRGMTALAEDAVELRSAGAVKTCRDEVISVDNTRGPASCSHPEMASELKDGYLICRCKKK